VASHHNKYVANKILFATKSQMDIDVGQIEELTKLLDPEFEVNALLLAPHPFTVSIIEDKRCVCMCVSMRERGTGRDSVRANE